MTQITMLQTRRGADGDTLQQYKKGETYDVRDNLACAFLSSGYAELAGVIYYQIKWKTGRVTHEPMSGVIEHYINRGVAQLVEV